MRDIDNLHLILLNMGRSTHNGDWNWKGISSPFARLFYVLEGNARINLPAGSQPLKPGFLYLIPPFTLHSYECDSFFSHIYIHIYEKTGTGTHSNILENFNFPVEIASDALDHALVTRLYEINPHRELQQFDPLTYDNPPTLLQTIAEDARQAQYAALETKGILSQLLSRFLRHAMPKAGISDERIRKVLYYIDKHIHQPFHTEELAELCHLSGDHFIRLFRKEMGCTPVRYINRKKIEKAQLMLLTENASVKDIAYRLSFDNISYFNRLFKHITGYTPTEYATQMLES